MLVRTYTHAWNMRVRIYAFDDVRLPLRNGVSVPQLLAGIGAAIIWVPLCLLVDVGQFIENAGLAFLAYVGPPVFVMLQADRPVAHEKTIEEVLGSMVARAGEPKTLSALAAAEPTRPVMLTASRWIPDR
ncbi:hypothetical protein Val02_87880 [Virgisporangium aliadipatigenens]|uniref:Uncharacterized protein n=1 Tax=Virgisporangium aliadipatigenens TaxID=741659 RepID=A0A8J3YWD0_9ACTN|nr:TcpE family conjugal transfer membrane protein [Virgisporangium aliadipatigenens]GIJ51902.1 hypothetical protein Val02_87880 [Virgisporangium aliadipatigenens]